MSSSRPANGSAGGMRPPAATPRRPGDAAAVTPPGVPGSSTAAASLAHRRRSIRRVTPRTTEPLVRVSAAVATATVGRTPEEISAAYEQWMKLAADNKINASNSWNLGLIDYFADMGILKEGGSINFQKASCTLDGCVKIYSTRVDAVATETEQLVSGLNDAKQTSRLADPGEDGDDDDEAAQAQRLAQQQQQAEKRRRARKAHGKTLEKDFGPITTKKYDVEFMVDPLFRKTCAEFDEGGAQSLLVNRLGVDNFGRIIFDASDALYAGEEDEPAAAAAAAAAGAAPDAMDVDAPLPEDDTIDLAVFGGAVQHLLAADLTTKTLCPTLDNFVFTPDMAGVETLTQALQLDLIGQTAGGSNTTDSAAATGAGGIIELDFEPEPEPEDEQLPEEEQVRVASTAQLEMLEDYVPLEIPSTMVDDYNEHQFIDYDEDDVDDDMDRGLPGILLPEDHHMGFDYGAGGAGGAGGDAAGGFGFGHDAVARGFPMPETATGAQQARAPAAPARTRSAAAAAAAAATASAVAVAEEGEEPNDQFLLLPLPRASGVFVPFQKRLAASRALAARTPRQRKEPFYIDFASPDAIDINEVFARGSAAINLPKTTRGAAGTGNAGANDLAGAGASATSTGAATEPAAGARHQITVTHMPFDPASLATLFLKPSFQLTRAALRNAAAGLPMGVDKPIDMPAPSEAVAAMRAEVAARTAGEAEMPDAFLENGVGPILERVGAPVDDRRDDEDDDEVMLVGAGGNAAADDQAAETDWAFEAPVIDVDDDIFTPMLDHGDDIFTPMMDHGDAHDDDEDTMMMMSLDHPTQQTDSGAAPNPAEPENVSAATELAPSGAPALPPPGPANPYELAVVNAPAALGGPAPAGAISVVPDPRLARAGGMYGKGAVGGSQGSLFRRSRMALNFARRSKRVDVKRLKENIWRKIRRSTVGPAVDPRLRQLAAHQQQQQQQQDPDAMDTDGAAGSSGSGGGGAARDETLDFKTLVTALGEDYTADQIKDISVPFCFICLLHLANEKNLHLEARGMDEIVVRPGSDA
ncbi:hypothetical protein H9P43_003368 [Blastocladiella emersonii ATCC 22665]|nr:hypothetical protein H9P43_003368 [Blastocladiella emersonii ATCC 22665]